MNVLAFLWNNAGLVVLALLYAGLVGGALVVGGRRWALAVATLGAGHLLYRVGRRHERSAQDERARDIEGRRKDAYRQIDERGTTRHDAADRLRKGDY